MKNFKIKFKAFTIHLLISAVVIALFMLIVTQIWYPGPLFKLENVWQGLQIMIPVDAILGPLLTFILFVPGKKALKFDLTIIASLQLAALTYGGGLIYQQRPIAFAFVIDRFEVILASDDYLDEIPIERFKDYNGSFPLLTYVLPAQTLEEKNQFVLNLTDTKKFPERHYPISENISKIIERSIQLYQLKPSDKQSQKILDNFIEQNKFAKNILLLPLQASTKETAIVVINSQTGQLVSYLNIDPWLAQSK